MNKNKYLPFMVAMGFAASLAIAIPAFAQTQGNMPNGWGSRFGMHGNGAALGVAGTVTAVSGSTLTVTAKMKPHEATTTAATGTVYTVDAANAKIVKNGATSTIASVAMGDTVMVQGTVSGTSVTATMVRDGINGIMGMGKQGFGKGATSTAARASLIQGNGQPVIAGSVASVSGTTVTITNASNVTYTINASTAKIVKNGTSTAIANVATADNVVVQGTVNGTTVTASSIIDQGSVNHGSGTPTGTPTGTPHPGGIGLGFFGTIGSFFKHLFGF